MKREFEEYLEAIAIPRALRDRIDVILEYVGVLCTEEMTELFVTDYIKEDGTREYENVLFFSNAFTVEAKQFVSQIDLDIACLKNSIHYLSIRAANYDFRQATEQSRIFLRAMLGSAMTLGFEIKGSRENCGYAMRILENVIKPNLIKR